MSEFFDGDAIKASKWFYKFQILKERGLLNLRGDQMFVEKLPPVKREKKVEGTDKTIILADSETYKNTVADTATDFGVVLMTGPGQLFEDGTTVECASKPGDVILLPNSVFWYGAFFGLPGYEAYTIGRVRDEAVPSWTHDYKAVFEVLNG